MDESGETRTEAEDAAIESAVIQQLIDIHPAQVTVTELILEIAGPSPGFAERDAVERAVRDLTGVGLLHRREDFVSPTRAALRFDELLDR